MFGLFMFHLSAFQYGNATYLAGLNPLDKKEVGFDLKRINNVGAFPDVVIALTARYWPLIPIGLILNRWLLNLNRKNFLAGMIYPYANMIRVYLVFFINVFANGFEVNEQAILGAILIMYCWPIKPYIDLMVSKTKKYQQVLERTKDQKAA